MKKFFLTLLIAFLGAGGFILYHFQFSKNSTFNIFSPLPDSKEVLFLTDPSSFWKPNLIYAAETDIPKPEVSATAALTYDTTTETLLYEKNIEKRLPIASLTKIMTAIVALEIEKTDKKVRVTNDAAQVGENAMGLSRGEVLTLEELLYGLMLPSGNDAAEAIAQGSRLGRGDFVKAMNRKAESLGLSDTNFTNPSGLEGDGDQFSTAVDLLVMARYGLSNPDFAKVVSTYEKNIPATDKHKAFVLYNETNLLTTYPGVKGVKIGFTWEAGHCLVTFLDYKDHQIIGVLLNSQNRREEMKNLLDYSLQSVGITPPPHI